MKTSEKMEKKYLATKMMLMIRILVGGYLIYTAYSLIGAIEKNTGKERIFFICFIIAFTAVGVWFIINSLYSMKIGKYVGGALDAGDAEEVVEVKSDVDESNQPELSDTDLEKHSPSEIEDKEKN